MTGNQKLHAPYARTPEFSKRKSLQRAVAGALAAGALVAASAVDARIVSVQLSARRLPSAATRGPAWGNTIGSPAWLTPKWIRPIRGTRLSPTSRLPRRSPPVSSTVFRNPARQPRARSGTC